MFQFHRDRAWEQVRNSVNAVSPCVRSVEEIKKKFKDLKCRTKQKANNMTKDYEIDLLKPFEERMLSFIGIDLGIDNIDGPDEDYSETPSTEFVAIKTEIE